MDSSLTEQSSNTDSAVTLRPVTPDDEPFLFDVYSSTRADEMAQWGWNAAQQEIFLRMQFDSQRRAYEMQYEEMDHSIIIFKDKQAGRIIVNRTEREFLLIDIALLPPYQNLGIATSLIKDLCTGAARKGVPVQLHVLKTNSAAARLYMRLGFSETDDSGVYLAMEWHPATLEQN